MKKIRDSMSHDFAVKYADAQKNVTDYDENYALADTIYSCGFDACHAHMQERMGKLMEAIRFALIYDPQIDTYKVKHTAYPKLKQALAEFERSGM